MRQNGTRFAKSGQRRGEKTRPAGQNMQKHANERPGRDVHKTFCGPRCAKSAHLRDAICKKAIFRGTRYAKSSLLRDAMCKKYPTKGGCRQNQKVDLAGKTTNRPRIRFSLYSNFDPHSYFPIPIISSNQPIIKPFFKTQKSSSHRHQKSKSHQRLMTNRTAAKKNYVLPGHT